MTDTAAPSSAPATPAPSTDPFEAIDATMHETYKEVQGRDEEEPVAAEAPAEATEAPETEDAPVEAAQEAAEASPDKSDIDIPPEWTAEMKEVFKTLPENARKYVRDRERTLHGKLSEQGRVLSTFKPIGEMLERYRHTFETRGLAPQQALGALFEVQDRLDRDPVAGIRQIADIYKVDLNRVFGAGPRDAQAGGQQPPAPGESAALQHEIASLKQQLQAMQNETVQERRAREARELQETQANIGKWSEGKPHFEKVRQKMASLISAGLASDLDDAYEQATMLDAEVRSSIEAEKAEKAKAEAAAKAAKDAEAAKKRAKLAVGKPGDRTAPVTSWEQTLENTARAAFARG